MPITPRPTAPDAPSRIPGSRVTLDRIPSFSSRHLGNSRPIQVLLPPGYLSDGAARYPVLYLNDGQDLEALKVRPTLERLYAARALAPLIVVGVHATADRLNEYGTVGVLNAQGKGARAGAYRDFLLCELLPAIEDRYRTLAGPEHTAIAGASLGGLSAFDTAWARPDRFGAVGVFSGSFWWRTDDGSVRAKQRSRIMHRAVRATSRRPRLRMWFQAGTEDETSDRDGNGVIDAIQDTTELMDELARKGYRRGLDMVYVEVQGGRHDQATWAAALPDFLTWAFPAS